MPPVTITQAELKTIFDYHPDGYLIWLQPPPCSVKPGDRAGGSLDKDGYPRVRFKGKYWPLHRLVYLWHHGVLPQRLDHIDRDRTNSRIENLRPVTYAQNSQNAAAKGGASGVKGVYFSRHHRRYVAYAAKDKKRVSRLARSLSEASAIATALRNQLHDDFACHD